MKEMKTLTMGGSTYEIVDAKARSEINKFNVNSRRNCAPSVNQTATGNTIAVNDSANRPLENLRIFGKTTQVVTTGAQLLDFSTMQMDSGGTTVAEVFEDGRIVTIKGTKAYAMGYIDIDVTNLVGQTLYLYGSKTGGNTPSLTARLVKADGTKTYVSTLTNGYTVLADDTTISIQFIANNTANALSSSVTASFTEVMVTTIKDAAWEPYTGRVPSPSPDSPQELNSVENPTISMYGKNLIPCPYMEGNFTRAGVTYTTLEDGTILVNGTSSGSYVQLADQTSKRIYLEAGVTYFFSCCPSGASSATYYAYLHVADQTLFDYGSGVMVTPNASGYASINIVLKAGTSVASLQFKPLLEVADAVSDYEPYRIPQTMLINRTLRGIPVSFNGNYVDENGQHWICDEIDFERGVYIQRVYSQTVEFYETEYGEDIRYNANLDRPASGNYEGSVLCDSLPFHKSASVGIRGVRVAVTTPNKLVAWYDGKDLMTATVTYILANPIETPLTEEELDVFDALYTHKTDTTVLNDQGAWMELEYNADVKTYIDRNSGMPSAEQIEDAVTNYLKNNPVSAGSTATIGTVNLLASKWVGSGSLHSQVVLINGVTKNSQIDLTPSVEQLLAFYEKDLTFVTANDDGVVTVYVIGQKPTNDYSVQVTITEVKR